jgi:hypothetical protein
MSAPCPTFGFLVMMELAATEAGVMADLRASWLDFSRRAGYTVQAATRMSRGKRS